LPKEVDPPVVRFGSLVALDPAELDRQMGICSVPLYEFSIGEAEVFHAGSDVERAREILKARDIFQYFFPAPDHLALGLIEKNHLSPSALVEWLRRPPDIGHPFGPLELIDRNLQFNEIVDALKDRGFSVEGEVGLELTDSGQISRATVKFKPREGFLSKLSNVVSINIDLNLKDLLTP